MYMNHSVTIRSFVMTAAMVFLAGCQSTGRQPQVVGDDTRARLSKALMASGDADGAAEALRTPADREADEAPASLTNAELYISAGQVDRGMRIAKATLASHPNDPELGVRVANMAVKADRLADA